MKAVGIRELKDRLSRYLEDVKRGEVILVTDRGTVVAEIRKPREEPKPLSTMEERLRPYVELGLISAPTRPNDPSAYGRPSFSIPAEVIDRDLDDSREDR